MCRQKRPLQILWLCSVNVEKINETFSLFKIDSCNGTQISVYDLFRRYLKQIRVKYKELNQKTNTLIEITFRSNV